MRAKTDIGQTADGRLVAITDPECVTQLAGAGCEVHDAQAKAWGALGNPQWDADAKAMKAPPEDKAVPTPKEAKRSK